MGVLRNCVDRVMECGVSDTLLIALQRVEVGVLIYWGFGGWELLTLCWTSYEQSVSGVLGQCVKQVAEGCGLSDTMLDELLKGFDAIRSFYSLYYL